MLIDTHCHLTDKDLRPRLAEILDRAQAAGVERALTVATGPDDWRLARQVVDENPSLCLVVGLHPHKADLAGPDTLAELERALGGPRVVAMGEIGLEYHYDFSPRDRQREVLAEQLQLARRLERPVVIHSREAQPDCVAVLAEQGFDNRRVVFHCFTGTADEARQILDHGWWISFAGVVTFKNATDVQAAAKLVPAERLLIETDSPYLTPEPIRRVRPNEPANLVHTAHYLADLRGAAFEDLAATCTANAVRFFGLE